MKIGAHVSIAGGIQNAPLNAAKQGCECFQFFSRSPRGGKYVDFTAKEIEEFKANCRKNKLTDYYIHTPYFINLASLDSRIKHGSINACRQELARGSLLGAQGIMTHLGSAGERSEKEAIAETVKSIDRILASYVGSTKFLIEISAGSGKILGDTFEEIAEILKSIKSKNVGVCFDTAHAFASGYDLSSKTAVYKTIADFDKLIGLEKLMVIHTNDSKVALGSRVDRHEHIGQGKIGIKGFRALMNHPKLRDIDFIIETPKANDLSDKENMKILKSLIKE
ncbi:MAG: deoxyribonuclease IV [Patescibacteria group bacterium]